MELKNPDTEVPERPRETPACPELPLEIRRMLGATPERDWPKIRAILVESEEELELVDLLPQLHRVMNQCPAKLMGRISKGEISVDQPDLAYSRLHDSIHGVRQAAQALLELAGVWEIRGDPPGIAPGGPGARVLEPLMSPPRPRAPEPALRPGLLLRID